MSKKNMKNETSKIFEAIVEESEDVVYAKDLDGRYLLMNTAAMGYLMTTKKALGWTDLDRLPKEIARKTMREDEDLMKTEVRKRFEETKTVDGKERSFLTTKSPLRDEQGNVIGLICIAKDITEDKLEKKLREKSERLQAIITSAPLILAATDKDGIITTSIGKGLTGLGQKWNKNVGKSVFETSRDDPLIIESFRRSLEGEECVETLEVDGDNKSRFFETVFCPTFDEQGLISGVIVVATDITRRKEAEESLSLSEEKFAKAFRTSPDAIAIISLENMNIVDVNEGFTQVTGFTKEETVGRSTDELGVWASSVEGQSVLEDIQTKRTIRDLEATLKTKAGEERQVVMSAEAIDLAGRPHMISVARDVTERKKTQEALRQKDRDIRKAYADVFSAVTDEKLLILTPEEIPAALGEPQGEPYSVSSFEQLADSRNFLRETLQTLGMSQDLLNRLILASGEAVVNGVKHAGACEVQVFSLDGTIQIKTSDRGSGIDFSDLPKATLLPGFSTRKSLGMGYAVILDICDRVLIATGLEGTALILEVGGSNEQDALDNVLARGLFKDQAA